MGNSYTKKIIYYLPTLPRKRFCTFSGTNKFSEWLETLKLLFSFYRSNSSESISEYEKLFANKIGSKYAFSFGAGRMALYAILDALEVGENDEIILPAFTCVVVVNAILYRKAKPIFIDISLNDFNILTSEIESKITSRTKAIYAQHTFGKICNLKEINQISKKYSIPVIEDAAHALGSCIGDNKAGTLSDIAFFSTDHSKTINTYLGGMVTTNNKNLAKKIELISMKTKNLSSASRFHLGLSFVIEYLYFLPKLLWFGRSLHALISKLHLNFNFRDELLIKKPRKYPYPCKITDIQAKIGVSQLCSLEKNVKHRQNLALILENNIGWYKLDEPEFSNYSWLRYSFLVKDREKFEKKFFKHFDLGVWFNTIFQGRKNNFMDLGYIENSCPNAEFAAKHIVNFPTHERVNIEFMNKIIIENLDWIKSELITLSKDDINF